MMQQKTPKSDTNNINKHSKLTEKLTNDLEELAKKLVQISNDGGGSGDDTNDQLSSASNVSGITQQQVIGDDCFELQKFCAKLEFLIQFRLKDKKTSPTSLSALNSTDLTFSTSMFQQTAQREYWTFILDALKSSRSFEDALKYVKTNTKSDGIRTNLGKARAFVRFCLQYGRLADALQQMTMDERALTCWYHDSAVWFNQTLKSRIIQFLYDLSECTFDLISSKHNCELDTQWPSPQPKKQQQLIKQHNNSLLLPPSSRHRAFSVSSLASFLNSSGDFSTTPSLEMDDDLQLLVQEQLHSSTPTKGPSRRESADMSIKEEEPSAAALTSPPSSISIYYDTNSTLQQQQQQLQLRVDELTAQLETAELQLKKVHDEKKELEDRASQLSEINNAYARKDEDFKRMQEASRLEAKHQHQQATQELNESLARQNAANDTLSDELKRAHEQYEELQQALKTAHSDNEALRQEISSVRFELSSKAMHEESLLKETLAQSEAITNLKQAYKQQECTVSQLRDELETLKRERQEEVSRQAHEIQRIQEQLQLKEEQSVALNEHSLKQNQALNEERQQVKSLGKQLDELRTLYKMAAESNKEYVAQLEADNNEIKKRLVKLVKEKADLWQKADNLEYENLVKANAVTMWIDDAAISNCMQCNSAFGLMLRKHHCRICLKIYCYYCCNNWIDYNNSKLRVCEKCAKTKEKHDQKLHAAAEASSPPTAAGDQQPPVITRRSSSDVEGNGDEETPDINFEVRAEKLESKSDSGSSTPTGSSKQTKPTTNGSSSNNRIAVATSQLEAMKSASAADDDFVEKTLKDKLEKVIMANKEIQECYGRQASSNPFGDEEENEEPASQQNGYDDRLNPFAEDDVTESKNPFEDSVDAGHTNNNNNTSNNDNDSYNFGSFVSHKKQFLHEQKKQHQLQQQQSTTSNHNHEPKEEIIYEKSIYDAQD